MRERRRVTVVDGQGVCDVECGKVADRTLIALGASKPKARKGASSKGENCGGTWRRSAVVVRRLGRRTRVVVEYVVWQMVVYACKAVELSGRQFYIGRVRAVHKTRAKRG